MKGTQKDYNLTAKWEHGGIFTLSLEGEEAITLNDGSTGTRFTYKVIRTLPEGTQAISRRHSLLKSGEPRLQRMQRQALISIISTDIMMWSYIRA